ncbi:MAG: hypothetical protein HND48_10485 [Chloroflexi bacterium]|nr:hypothetical protein [Chloroflexota bacterium]
MSNAGGSNMVEYQVFLQGAEQPPEASIADTAPVEPNVNELAGVLSSILGGSGNNAASFAVIGEKSIDPAMFLSPFGDGQYELSDTGSGVDGIIQFYLATTLSDGSNPFQRVGAAVDNSLRAANFAYDFGGCGDTLVACGAWTRLHRPSPSSASAIRTAVMVRARMTSAQRWMQSSRQRSGVAAFRYC